MTEPLTRGEKVVAFIEGFCKVPEGSKVGQPVVLDEFQKKFILAIYDNPHGTRKAYLSIARKNGKTALIAGILLAHICGPEAKKNAQIVSGAMSREQASLVFNLASKMVQMDTHLAFAIKMTLSGKRLTGLAKNTEYKALSADGTTAHGLSPTLAILDEVGQIKGPTSAFVEAITTSQGAHDEPLLIAISTSASSDADMFSQWCDDAIRSGDPHTVCHVYKADEGCDLLDREQWKKANPALGSFRNEKDLEEQLKQASRIPSMEASARNLLLNQRISLHSLWLAPSIWRANAAKPDLQEFRRHPVALGLDLSTRNDLTAAVASIKDDNGDVHLLPFTFVPEAGLEDKEKRDKAPYLQWAREGLLTTVPGATLDYFWLCAWLKQKFDQLGIEISIVIFDRWRIAEFKVAAEQAGFAQEAEWLECGQGYRDMSPRIEHFETYLLQEKIRHGGHPLLNMAAANAVAVGDPAGNRKIDKTKVSQKIDPLVAAVMSVGAFMEGVSTFDAGAYIG